MSIEQIQVLLVEDDEVSAQAATTILERLGCQVDPATDGEEAVELFRTRVYDLILMDWQMPHMDGFETTARIRAMPHGRVTPIVGTSANVDRVECLAAGMNDVIRKPYSFSSMRMGLTKWTHWEEGPVAESEAAGK